MSPKRLHLYRRLLRLAIGTSLLLILFLPHYASFHPPRLDSEEGEWVLCYFWDDEEMSTLFIPLYLFFPALMVFKIKFIQIVIKLCLIPATGILFLIGLGATGLPSPDFAPGYVMLLYMAFLPFLVMIHYYDNWEKFNRKGGKLFEFKK